MPALCRQCDVMWSGLGIPYADAGINEFVRMTPKNLVTLKAKPSPNFLNLQAKFALTRIA